MNTLKITIVIPPWTILDTPNLGAHLLQASISDENCQISIFYSDQLLAKKIGVEKYKYISEELLSQYELIQERLFVKTAYPDLPYLGKRVSLRGISYNTPRDDFDKTTDWEMLFSLENAIEEWVDSVAFELANSDSQIIGFSISHQQTNAAISLINRIKKLNHQKIIIVGGSNCDGKMSQGILSLSESIDYVFSGKSELSFKKFIQDFLNGIKPNTKIIMPIQIENLDELPIPVYDDYFLHIHQNGLQLNHWINIESSRGCWWGVAHQCKFCGVNGSQIKYKAKSPNRIFDEITLLSTKYQVKNIRMVDTLMPRKYFNSLIPKLKELGLNIFYEQRADLSFNEMKSLKLAGINSIQVGIEALSLTFLNLINKGVSVADNINCMRYAFMLNIYNGWNLLYNIPNEDVKGWEETYQLIPYITHLPPPSYFRPIELARFSPYYNSPKEYNIDKIRYFDVYDDIYPCNADKNSLAWLFYSEFSKIDVKKNNIIKNVKDRVKQWIKLWSNKNTRDVLMILSKGTGYILIDTRSIAIKKAQIISEEQASVAVLGKESCTFENYKLWAEENKVCIEIDGNYVALCNTTPNLYEFLQNKYTKSI